MGFFSDALTGTANLIIGTPARAASGISRFLQQRSPVRIDQQLTGANIRNAFTENLFPAAGAIAADIGSAFTPGAAAAPITSGQVSNDVARQRFVQRLGFEPSPDQLQQEKDTIVDEVNARESIIPGSGSNIAGIPTIQTDVQGDGIAATVERQEQFIQQQRTQANQYIDQLIGDTRGDFDLAFRILDAEHTNALGTNDAARAEFLELVSSELEQEIGQIPYDFNVSSERLTTDRDTALQRLGEQEQLTRQQIDREAEEARQLQTEGLSQRGLLTGRREETVGTGARDVRRLDEEVQRELAGLGRAVGREREDIGRGFERGIQDVTTTARRGAQGAEQAFGFGTEQAERARDKAVRQLERERQNILNQLEQFRFFGIGA